MILCIITLNTPNFFFGHFVPLGILFLWAFCPFRNNVFWAFYPLGHFVVLGQNDFWAFCLWAFCHTWAFCHFGHFIIESFSMCFWTRFGNIYSVAPPKILRLLRPLDSLKGFRPPTTRRLLLVYVFRYLNTTKRR